MRPTSLVLACLAFGATAALAQPPADLKPAPVLIPRPDEVVSGAPIAYYTLALTWTPEWCRSGGSGATAGEMECSRPRGFTLHGLWPDGAHPPYPGFCRPAGPLDAATVREMWPRTPSPVLLQHEWQKHGTCGPWPDAKAYFGQEARLYDKIVTPKIEGLRDPTAGAVRDAFIAKNPWLTSAEIFVQSQRGTEALTEVRVCYDLKFQPVACPGGNGAPDRVRLTLAR
ncbi:MAG TPA: ribonuclease T, partial [Phenylobacterium sp.]|nr:ribonuclease T [Phenylobacterium sp.]